MDPKEPVDPELQAELDQWEKATDEDAQAFEEELKRRPPGVLRAQFGAPLKRDEDEEISPHNDR